MLPLSRMTPKTVSPRLIECNTCGKMGVMAKTIRQIRREAEITQSEAARQIGVSRETYARWEAGTHYPREGNQERLVEWVKMVASAVGVKRVRWPW